MRFKRRLELKISIANPIAIRLIKPVWLVQYKNPRVSIAVCSIEVVHQFTFKFEDVDHVSYLNPRASIAIPIVVCSIEWMWSFETLQFDRTWPSFDRNGHRLFYFLADLTFKPQLSPYPYKTFLSHNFHKVWRHLFFVHRELPNLPKLKLKYKPFLEPH